VTPFSSAVDLLPHRLVVGECSHCKGKINPQSKIENHFSLKCHFCGKITDMVVSEVSSEASCGYRFQKEEGYKELLGAKRILFLVEASQYLYEAKVHKSIFNCLSAI
jgi:hypothetical protein